MCVCVYLYVSGILTLSFLIIEGIVLVCLEKLGEDWKCLEECGEGLENISTGFWCWCW